jgi:hypothetical protein
MFPGLTTLGNEAWERIPRCFHLEPVVQSTISINSELKFSPLFWFLISARPFDSKLQKIKLLLIQILGKYFQIYKQTVGSLL